MKQDPQIAIARGCGFLVLAAVVAGFLVATDTRGAAGWIVIMALFAAPFVGLQRIIKSRFGDRRPPP